MQMHPGEKSLKQYPSFEIASIFRDSRAAGCAIIQKITYFPTVMPDLIRHPVLYDAENKLDSGSSPE